MKTISVLHPYLEDRIHEIELGRYPKNHLWGLDAMQSLPGFRIKFLKSNSIKLPRFIEKLANRLFFRNSPGIKAELSALLASRDSTLIYSVCGPLSLISFFGKAKVVSWVFRKPSEAKQSIFSPYLAKKLKLHSAFLCLTQNAASVFKEYSYSRFLPWCVDLELFDKDLSYKNDTLPFFLATGKTGRDYKTLIDGAKDVPAELRIIGPRHQKPDFLPHNIKWISSTEDPPDTAIDYPKLRKWYSQCIGVCIPLFEDAEDTCGYTNMLEAMAMAKPVLMTSSGCLHLRPEDQSFGYSIQPGNSNAWTQAMTNILTSKDRAISLGKNGLKIVQEGFSVEKFNQALVCFMKEILAK